MVKNFSFLFFFFLGIVLISIFFLPSFFLPQRIALYGGKLMGHWSKICLQIFLSTKIVIKGKDKIITDKKFFIACSHQSMFETFFLQTVFNSPVFILKKELLKIPIFGWYLSKVGSISIDRNKINRENIDFFSKIKSLVNSSDRPVIIFPQGTRTRFDERRPFKKGVSRIYGKLKITCQPVAINSGIVWPKSGELVSNKRIVISILDPIESGQDEKVFLNYLQNVIYNELDNISNLS